MCYYRVYLLISHINRGIFATGPSGVEWSWFQCSITNLSDKLIMISKRLDEKIQSLVEVSQFHCLLYSTPSNNHLTLSTENSRIIRYNYCFIIKLTGLFLL